MCFCAGVSPVIKRIEGPERPVSGTLTGGAEWPVVADLSRSHHGREPMSLIDPLRSVAGDRFREDYISAAAASERPFPMRQIGRCCTVALC